MFRKFKSYVLWKDSAGISLAVIAAIESILAITCISLNDIVQGSWFVRLGVIIFAFIVLTCAVAIIKTCRANKQITLKIRGIDVVIKEGDIFQEKHWKLIPFNEYFDTRVDDIIIAHNSLNGVFITNYVTNIRDLQETI